MFWLLALPLLFVAGTLAFSAALMGYVGWLKLKRRATASAPEARRAMSSFR
jgi:hypothetical protein